MKSVFFAISLLVVLACASVDKSFVLNGESPLTFEEDVKSIIETLPNRKKQQFLIALLSVQMDVAESPLAFLGNPNGNAVNYELLSDKLDGLTHEQVLKHASKLKIFFKVLSE